MASSVVLALCAILGYFVYSNLSGLRKNIAAAKRSGLPYMIAPVNIYNIVWLLSHRLLLPALNHLPNSWTRGWLPFMMPDWVWENQFEPFEEHGDAFLTVSPGAVHVWLANAEAIRQVTSRREAFPKPLESYKILEIFGRNIITTEGSDWKKHRKVTSPGFNEKNNALVFAESCRQTEGMLRKWNNARESGDATLNELPTDAMRLTLHIISRIGFGVSLLWPGETASKAENTSEAAFSSNTPPSGHTMSFEHSLDTLLENLIWVLLTPKWLLNRLPFAGAHKAYESFVNWTQYMNELFAQKVQEARDGKQMEGMDIMGSLVRSSYGVADSTPGQVEKGEAGKPVLSDTDIFGNAFVMIVAGHETTANSIHFSLMELAMAPGTQRLLQKEVQRIYEDEPSEKWDYDANINELLGGMVGAVLNEQLRLMPPVIAIPKHVTRHSDQDIILEGKKHTLPAGAHINLATVCAHRNPKYWPAQPSKVTDRKDDLNDFRPERWFVKANGNGSHHESVTDSEDDGEDFGGFTGRDSCGELFRPVKGSYLPFSDGARSCLGRRLAQVKIMGVLAVISQKYSIELAVDEWATDDEVSKMSDDEKREIYRKAVEKSRKTIRGATTLITLKLHPGFIPVRVVKQGEERFINLIE